jgi:Alpha/beta hydrolase family
VDAVFVLMHSPSVGPATWTPVAERLRSAGATVAVPSLLDVADAPAPFWPRVVELVRSAIDDLPADRPVVLAAHSNAGLFVPLIVEAAGPPVAGCVFVDAALPARSEATPVAPPELLEMLQGKVADDGRLPPWTAWWDDSDVAPMFPDPETRRLVEAEQQRLPLAYYQQMIPVPPGWDRRPCSYLLFGPPYDEVAEDARRRGWKVTHIPGEHLHEIVDPDAVAEYLLAAG